MEKFPWAGHLGGRLVEEVAKRVERAGTTLVFTNVRSQTEYWYHALLSIRPQWENDLGIHHGSLDRKDRNQVEEASSLRKRQGRGLHEQSRFGRGLLPGGASDPNRRTQGSGPLASTSGAMRAPTGSHQSGNCVPTQAMELIEYAAAREAMEERKIEERKPLRAFGPAFATCGHSGSRRRVRRKGGLRKSVRPGRTGRSPRRNGSGFWSS